MFSSSLMFPGQGWVVSVSMADGVNVFCGMPVSVQYFVMK